MSLESEELERLLEWAMEWQLEPLNRVREGGSFTVDNNATSIEDHTQEYAFTKLAEETFPIYNLEIDPKDLKTDLLAIIQDLAFEYTGDEQIESTFPVDESIEKDGLVATFQAKIHTVTAQVGQGGSLETTFYFPLNITQNNKRDLIKVFDVTIQAISESEWSNQLNTFAEYPDTHGENIVKSLCKDSEYTFWKATIQSKGRTYAAKKLENALYILCSKINFSKYRWETTLLHERSKSSIDMPRWSWFQHPIALLIKGENNPLETAIISRESPDTIEVDWADQTFLRTYEQFPGLNYGADGPEAIFQNSLLEYQRALTSRDMHDSFFGLWRCIEGLSQVEYGEKSDITDRALWALQVCNPDERSSFVEMIADQLYARRNSWVHEPNWDDVWRTHERVAKCLADAMIQIYISHLLRNDEVIISELFDHATMAPPQRDSNYRQAMKKQEAIEKLREIESD